MRKDIREWSDYKLNRMAKLLMQVAEEIELRYPAEATIIGDIAEGLFVQYKPPSYVNRYDKKDEHSS